MTTYAPPATGQQQQHTASPYHKTFLRVVTSEWIKFWSLRSTLWTLAITVVVMVGYSVMVAFSFKTIMDSPDVTALQMPPMAYMLLSGYAFAQFSLAVLGALSMTSEYRTGMIRSTLAAVPTRLPVLWAKLLVLAVASAVVVIVGLALSYLVTVPILSGTSLAVSFSGDVPRMFLGTAIYLVIVALMSMAIGGILRHSAGAISASIGLILLLPMVFSMLSSNFKWAAAINSVLPSSAGERAIMDSSTLASTLPGSVVLGPWQGLGVMALWAVAFTVLAAIALKKRDA